ncbi:MAG: hypothetical protein AAF722_07830 [Cyanobacteria bacterium P01_C01_bin.70]
MTHISILENAPELSAGDYVVVGVATCFRRQDGELETLKILEPVPSAYLESLLQGIPTSYEMIMATTLGELLDSSTIIRQTGIADVQLCENFSDRAIAAARTYQGRPSAQTLVAMGNRQTNLNYSTEKKRVLNFKNVVKTADNVRQHAHTHKKL